MNRDQTVVDLSDVAAVLPLHAGGVIAFFRVAGIIDDANRLRIGVIASHNLLESIAELEVVPDIAVQKLLERPRRDVVK